MAGHDSKLVETAMEAARRYALSCFRSLSNRDELAADAMSTCWELAQQAGGQETAGTLARYAVRRVKDKRQFRESVRSLTGPNSRSRKKPLRAEVDLSWLASRRDNPAVIAITNLCFAEWRSSLNAKQLAFLDRILQGDTNAELMELFHCSAGNVSQYRRRLYESFLAYLSR